MKDKLWRYQISYGIRGKEGRIEKFQLISELNKSVYEEHKQLNEDIQAEIRKRESLGEDNERIEGFMILTQEEFREELASNVE